MGRKKMPKVDVYMLSDITIDEIIDKHIELITTPIEILEDVSVLSCYDNCISPKFITKVSTKPRRTILYHKFCFLLHLIISRCSASEDNRIQLHSERLKNVLGSDYNLLLKTLREMEIIIISSDYVIGEHSRFILLMDWRVCVKPIINIKVAEYIAKWGTLVENDVALYKQYQNVDFEIKINDGKVYVVKKEEKVIGEREQWLYNRYNESLSHLDLKVSRSDALEYIDSLFAKKDSHKYHHCIYSILSFDNKNVKISSVDKQDRIYHYLSNLRKSLKCLFNLKFQLDIANSHPLLLCKLLITKYKLDYNILKIIYNKERVEVCDLHNVSEQLYNELKHSVLDISLDIIRFIYACSKGMMWDELNNSFPEYSRDEIKSNAFALIFYNPRNIARYTEFGKKFMSVYPNVYIVIEEIKDRAKLPLLMMKYESVLMRRILTKCYENDWKVISVHDAIVALDTPENDGLEPMAIKRIINDVYREVLLHPTIHYEEFPFPTT